MRQSITTKYLGPTNSKGSRVKAIARKADNWGKEMSVTLPLDYSLNSDANHTKAAKACAEKFGWAGLWVGGGNIDDNGYVYVCVESVATAALRSNMHGQENIDWFYIADKEIDQ